MAIVTTNSVTITSAPMALVMLKDAMFRDELLTFAAAGTVEAGTILARNTTSGKLVPFVKGGSGGAEVPNAVITYDVTVDAPGDVATRVAIVGKARIQELIIAADGDGSNIDAAVIDGLRKVGITPIDVKETTQI